MGGGGIASPSLYLPLSLLVVQWAPLNPPTPNYHIETIDYRYFDINLNNW